jgi:hypothetical protein
MSSASGSAIKAECSGLMSTPDGFEVTETHALYRPEKGVSIQEAFDLVGAAIEFAREHQIKRLLVDTTKLSGFQSPTAGQRFRMAELFVAKARSRVKVVLVAKKEMIDPDRIGVTVGRNRGLLLNVFDSETDALKWLLDAQAR